jgi:uncharacterized membrane protein
MRDAAVAVAAGSTTAIHPLHAFLLAGAVPPFLGGLLSDIAYARTYEIQWSNFAAWLIAGAMVFTGFALLWALIALVRERSRWGLVYAGVLLATFVLGLINNFVHAQDAYAVMPEGLVLSALVALLAAVATWIGFSTLRAGDGQ